MKWAAALGGFCYLFVWWCEIFCMGDGGGREGKKDRRWGTWSLNVYALAKRYFLSLWNNYYNYGEFAHVSKPVQHGIPTIVQDDRSMVQGFWRTAAWTVNCGVCLVFRAGCEGENVRGVVDKGPWGWGFLFLGTRIGTGIGSGRVDIRRAE
ncbi:hypothetical protein P154DRAFT_561887 [Amniculicola lignicola CBS 123094]|uniref:Uncharacterized protein n=1 Tax=Amniculicola lignicola CBS 123094 TaxID=1392246 RepID=A0A6A5WUK3_9PLEO|nr:hypothetical protein P154DRAFT_561887 [Amniculicola lignicola CBS 123094]